MARKFAQNRCTEGYYVFRIYENRTITDRNKIAVLKATEEPTKSTLLATKSLYCSLASRLRSNARPMKGALHNIEPRLLLCRLHNARPMKSALVPT